MRTTMNTEISLKLMALLGLGSSLLPNLNDN